MLSPYMHVTGAFYRLIDKRFNDLAGNYQYCDYTTQQNIPE